MEDEIEKAILTLADPVAWKGTAHATHRGWWHGEYNGSGYEIHSPTTIPGDVDATELSVLWNVVLFPGDESDATEDEL